jgi:hypothetical protein
MDYYMVLVKIHDSATRNVSNMNRAQKRQYVIELYKKDATIREIIKIMHMSPREVCAITNKVKAEIEANTTVIKPQGIPGKNGTQQKGKVVESPLHTGQDSLLKYYLPVACRICGKEFGFGKYDTVSFECNRCFATHLEEEVKNLTVSVHRIRSRHLLYT